MKRITTLLVVVLLTLTVNAQKIKSKLTTDATFIEYQTARNGLVDVEFNYVDKVAGQTMDNDKLNTIINYTLSVTQEMLKSRRSFIPIRISVKYKYNTKGKHKYSVHIWYAATNSYGGEVEGFQMLTFNKKLKETVGSVMLRMN